MKLWPTVIIAGFVVVIGVNITMMVLALNSQTGKTTDTAYEDAQVFNARYEQRTKYIAEFEVPMCHRTEQRFQCSIALKNKAQHNAEQLLAHARARFIYPSDKTKDLTIELTQSVQPAQSADRTIAEYNLSSDHIPASGHAKIDLSFSNTSTTYRYEGDIKL